MSGRVAASLSLFDSAKFPAYDAIIFAVSAAAADSVHLFGKQIYDGRRLAPVAARRSLGSCAI